MVHNIRGTKFRSEGGRAKYVQRYWQNSHVPVINDYADTTMTTPTQTVRKLTKFEGFSPTLK